MHGILASDRYQGKTYTGGKNDSLSNPMKSLPGDTKNMCSNTLMVAIFTIGFGERTSCLKEKVSYKLIVLCHWKVSWNRFQKSPYGCQFVIFSRHDFFFQTRKYICPKFWNNYTFLTNLNRYASCTINLLKTSPEYTRAGVYGSYVLEQKQIVNGLNYWKHKSIIIPTICFYWYGLLMSLLGLNREGKCEIFIY